MKRYFVPWLILTLILALISLVMNWISPDNFTKAFPVLVVYFAGITLVQHILVTRSTKKDPRAFIRNFFGITLGVLILHFVVLATYMFSHIHQAHANKIFAIGFCIGYVCYLIFETVALLLYVRHKQQEDAVQKAAALDAEKEQE